MRVSQALETYAQIQTRPSSSNTKSAKTYTTEKRPTQPSQQQQTTEPVLSIYPSICPSARSSKTVRDIPSEDHETKFSIPGAGNRDGEKVHILHTGYKKRGLSISARGVALRAGIGVCGGGRIQAYRMISQKLALRIKARDA